MPSECNYLYYVDTKDIFKPFGFDGEQKESSDSSFKTREDDVKMIKKMFPAKRERFINIQLLNIQ